MACPRCGCRMVSKLSASRPPRLLCCDCGLDLTPAPAQRQGGSRRSQLLTIGLIALFALTAAGLMTLNDQQNPSLLNEEPLNLNERRQGNGIRQRWDSVLPRPSSLQP